MLHSNKHSAPRRGPNPLSGFTLTELLISMTIFATLMTGLVVLFDGAMTTVRQGYQSMDAHEIGRATLAVMERDLKSAFTARELGEFYQFQGTSNGFMFVGLLDNGKMGRVTYVANRLAGTRANKTYKTLIPEAWGKLRQRIAAADLANKTNNGALFDTQYPFPGSPDTIVDFPVEVETGALLRYAEEGRTDLDMLDLWTDGAGNSALWPVIDPEFIDGDDDGAPEGSRQNIYKILLSSINPGAAALNYTRDLRNIIFTVRNTQPNDHLFTLSPLFVDRVVGAARRTFWLDWLSGSYDSLLPSFWTSNADIQNVLDYVIAEDILVRAQLLANDGTTLLPIAVLPTEFYFKYGKFNENGEDQYATTFNGAANILGYEDFLTDLATADPINTVLAFDVELTSIHGNVVRTSETLGSPLLPELPAVVRPGFYIMQSNTRVGGLDFRRWFSQAIDLPSGVNRNIPANLAPNPPPA